MSGALAPPAHAAGTVTQPTEAALRAALEGGGLVKIQTSGTIALQSELVIESETTIDATGFRVTLDGGGRTRLLNVRGGPVTLRALSFKNGRAVEGGAILSKANLSLQHCFFESNVAAGTDGAGAEFSGADGRGGAVLQDGAPLRLFVCTFSRNEARGGAGDVDTAGNGPFSSPGMGGQGGNGAGGAIFARAASVSAYNSTFSRNEARGGGQGGDAGGPPNGSRGSYPGADGGAGGSGLGGAVATVAGSPSADGPTPEGALTSVHCTWVGNTAGAGGGGAGGSGYDYDRDAPGLPGRDGDVSNGAVSAANDNFFASVAAGNVPNSVVGLARDSGYNVFSDAPGGLGATSLKNTDARLGPLLLQGGLVPTAGLNVGSPAVDRVPSAISLPVDARSVARPQGAASDAGAFEGTIADRVAPTVSITSLVDPAGATSIALPRLNAVAGVANDDSGVARVDLLLYRVADRLYWNGTAWTPAPAPLSTVLATTGDGASWSRTRSTAPNAFPVGAGLPDGPYIVTAVATDGAGNVARSSRTLVIDATTPAAPVIASPARGSFHRLAPRFFGTAVDNLRGSGIARVEAALQRPGALSYWNGRAWAARPVFWPLMLHGGAWSVPDAPLSLADGRYIFSVRSFDRAANPALATAIFSIDNAAPRVAILAPGARARVASLPFVSGQAMDTLGGSGVARVQVSIRRMADGRFWTGSAWGALTRLDAAVTGAAWRLSRVPSASQLAAGTYQIAVLAFDRVGNIGVAQSSFGIGQGMVAPPTTRLSIASATQSNAGDNRMWNVEVKLRFSGPLQPASAANASLYTIESLTDGSFTGAGAGAANAITASYSAADNTVTLRFLVETGYIGRDIQSPVSTVEISWAGLRDVHGVALSGRTPVLRP